MEISEEIRTKLSSGDLQASNLLAFLRRYYVSSPDLKAPFNVKFTVSPASQSTLPTTHEEFADGVENLNTPVRALLSRLRCSAETEYDLASQEDETIITNNEDNESVITGFTLEEPSFATIIAILESPLIESAQTVNSILAKRAEIQTHRR